MSLRLRRRSSSRLLMLRCKGRGRSCLRKIRLFLPRIVLWLCRSSRQRLPIPSCCAVSILPLSRRNLMPLSSCPFDRFVPCPLLPRIRNRRQQSLDRVAVVIRYELVVVSCLSLGESDWIRMRAWSRRGRGGGGDKVRARLVLGWRGVVVLRWLLLRVRLGGRLLMVDRGGGLVSRVRRRRRRSVFSSSRRYWCPCCHRVRRPPRRSLRGSVTVGPAHAGRMRADDAAWRVLWCAGEERWWLLPWRQGNHGGERQARHGEEKERNGASSCSATPLELDGGAALSISSLVPRRQGSSLMSSSKVYGASVCKI